MPAPNSISADKLARLIGTPACPIIVDVRRAHANSLLPTALSRDPAAVVNWSRAFTRRAVIVVDDTGSTDAEGAGALLRAAGAGAEILEGGFAGWRRAGLPVLDMAHLPPRHADGGTLWVTRARPKVDRIACPWLIRRFVDRQARFLFASAAEVLNIAERFGAEPFDVEGDGVFWNHRAGRCTFDLMLETFGLAGHAPLARLATVVRAADTDQLELAPQAAGLLAISLGLSRVHADDIEQLEAGMPVYDALFRWSRDAQGETHDRASHGAPRGRPPC